MKTQRSRVFILLSLAILIISQIMCEFTEGKGFQEHLSDEEISIILLINNVNFDIDQIDTQKPSSCQNYEPSANQFTKFEFKDDRLVVVDNAQVTRYYVRDYRGNYCRQETGNIQECIYGLTENSFIFNVNQMDSQEICFSATYNFNFSDDVPEEEDIQPGEFFPECNATHLIDIEYGEWNIAETDDGIPFCEYTLNFKNASDEKTILIVYLLHKTDGYQNSESRDWFLLDLFVPGHSMKWSGNIWNSHLVDKDFSGPSMKIVEKVAAFYDTEECRLFMGETEFYEDIAITVQSLCPID